MVLIDQFRADYLQYLRVLPQLLPYQGVCDTNSIPTSTEAMHANIATGIYPKDHGLISKNTLEGSNGVKQLINKFNTGVLMSMAAMAANYGVTTFLVGGKLETVDVFGLDKEVKIKISGRSSDAYQLTGSSPFILDEILLNLPEESLSLENLTLLHIASYLKQIQDGPTLSIFALPSLDVVGHSYGPHSHEVIRALQKTEESLAKLVETYQDQVWILVGDHGCRQTTEYVIEVNRSLPREVRLYHREQNAYCYIKSYSISKNVRHLELDGEILRLWINGDDLLTEDRNFLSRFGTIISSSDDVSSEFLSVYENSLHTNLGDLLVVANPDVTFCKSSWLEESSLLQVQRKAPIAVCDLPAGEHGSWYLEDRLTGYLTNQNILPPSIYNVQIRPFIELNISSR